jgi:branched-chain amino acid transport system permease protein
LTIIISLVLFYVGMSWRWVTGGDDGISLTEIPEFGFEKYSLSLYDPIVNYFFVLFFFCSSFLILHRITVSPLGKIFVSIRENEGRTRLIGYNVERFKLIAFITSATFCGLAGALYSLTLRFSNVRMTHWTVSSDGMIWTIIGGVGSLYGAVLGTTLLIFSTDYISSWFENHRIITGAILVFFVVAAPKGIIGIIRGLLERRGYLGKK